ncbi:serine/threonine-protein kinase [Candidatus Uabimicrobium amorphum]|uniref:Serine/threonine protein kinase n=1 Tax=Uabimicrobium amorphum TaxID=2596890 RepID=A0A5S9IUD6_UABAM|nr:serine/threonine-protein kinase [Candidatus Uabimicrobium amorphum]BBM88289.1 serine/threonine protein kinase [Candidatus Uabimicrobium amorphum]
METNTATIEKLMDTLQGLCSVAKGSLEIKNAYVIKQFNFENGEFTSWFTSNRNRQMGNIGFSLLQEGFISCKNLYNAFLEQVELRQHYCDILIENRSLSPQNLQVAINGSIFEEIAEVFTWKEINFKVLERQIEQSSMYGNPYLHSFKFSTSIAKIISQIPMYLQRWSIVCEQLQNLDVILRINPGLEEDLYKYVQDHYILYKNDLSGDENSIFLNSISQRLEKNLLFFDKHMTLREVLPLLSMDPLAFCSLTVDLVKYNYLSEVSVDEITALSKKENNMLETKRLTNVALSVENESTSHRPSTPKYGAETVKLDSSQSLEERFPGYEILEELGRGAMGTVYKARQKSLNRDVAIKVVRPNLTIDDMYIKRLELEAKTMAKLRHPNIVAAIDFGFHKNLCYIVMEYIPGGVTLQDIIKERDHISEKEALRIGIFIAEALKYLEHNHLVHRDIKPSNILLDRGQTAKLADLGLIKDTKSDSEITFPGAAVGTPAYMSPEQLQMDEVIDVRSDIYSLGATLFYALTGKSRFNNATSPGVIYHKIVSQGSAYVRKEKSLSPVIRKVLVKMLEPDREKRYQNPQQLIRDLELARKGKNTSRSSANSWRRPLLTAIVFGMIIALLPWGQFFATNVEKQSVAQKKDKVEDNKQYRAKDVAENIEKPEQQKDQLPDVHITIEDPQDDYLQNEIFEELLAEFNDKKYQKVISEIDLLDSEEITDELINLQGQCYIRLRKYKQALVNFERLASRKETQLARIGTAMCYYLQNKFPKALAVLQDGQNTENIDFFYLRARIYFQLQEIEKARKDLNYILQKSPDFWKANYLLSFIWLKQQPQRALESLDISLENGAEKEDAVTLGWLYYYKGFIYYQLKDLVAAKKYFRLSYKNLATQDALFYLGLLTEKRNKKRSIELYTNALTRQKLSALNIYDVDMEDAFLIPQKAIHLQRGKMFGELNNYQRAQQEYQRAIQLDTKYLPALKGVYELQKKRKEFVQAISSLELIIELQPQNIDNYWQRANLNYKLGKYKKVLVDCKKLHERSFAKEKILYLRMKSYIALKDKRALNDIETWLRKHPKDVKITLHQAQLQHSLGKINEAIKSYESVFKQQTKNREAYTYLENVYLQRKEYDKLVHLYEKLLDIYPENIEYLYGAARCYISLEEYRKSVGHLQAIQKLKPGYLESLYYLGYGYYFTGNKERALSALSLAIKHRTKNEEAYYLRGNIYYRDKMYRKAVIDLSRYLKYFSQNTTALSLRAQSYQNLRLYGRALKDYRSLVILSPQKYKYFEKKGCCEVKLMLYKQAVGSFSRAKEHISLEADSYQYLGYCYSQLGKLDKAIANYQLALKMNPSHALARANYAITLYSMKKYKAALQQISKAIALDRSNTDSLENRGKIYLKLEEYQNAVVDFSTVTQLDPENRDAFYYLALSHYKLRNFSQAELYFKQALFGSKKKDLAKKYLQIISEIKSK